MSNKNELEQICKRLDQLTKIIEKNFNELDDIGDIRSVVEDLRANLLQTIDDRVEYVISKQFSVYELQISQIEDKIKTFSINDTSSKDEVKNQLLTIISSWKEELIAIIGGVDDKINRHLKEQINWKQIIVTALISGIISIGLMVGVIVLDGYFGWGLAELFQNIK